MAQPSHRARAQKQPIWNTADQPSPPESALNVPDLPVAPFLPSAPQAAATRATLLAYHDAWRSRDLDRLMALYDPAIEYNDLLQNRRVAYSELREYLAASMPVGEKALQTYTERLLIDGDTGVLQYRVTLDGSDGLVSFSAVEALSVRDGLIFKVNEYAVLTSDTAASRRQGSDAIGRLGLSARQIGALATDLQQYFQQSKAWLDPALDLPQVAAATGYTRNQISFFLNQVRGQSFYALLAQLRLAQVLTQLRGPQTSASIEAMARAAGFNSLSTFYRCFKQHTGMSPTRYLQQMKQADQNCTP
jgi:AraC-like DNA-binding protein/ketosteroid isomerase-like protein